MLPWAAVVQGRRDAWKASIHGPSRAGDFEVLIYGLVEIYVGRWHTVRPHGAGWATGVLGEAFAGMVAVGAAGSQSAGKPTR